MVRCLLELHEAEEDVPEHESEDWISTIEAGGLTHIGNMTFGAFASEIRQYLSRAFSRLGKIKPELQARITSNDDVQFIWALVSAGWEEEEGQALLEQIIDQLSFASGGWKSISKPKRSLPKNQKESESSYADSYNYIVCSVSHF